MPQPRKRKRSASPQGSRKPKDVFRLKAYFEKHSLDLSAPCSATSGSEASTSTVRTLQKSCWVAENIGLWNSLLHPVGIELRENVAGKLTLQTFVRCNPNSTQYRVVSAFLVKRLLNDHHCVQRVDLSYAGELFGDKSQLVSQIRPNDGVQQITLDGRQVSKPELSKLVRVSLRGNPFQIGFRNASLGAAEMTALAQSIKTMTRLADLDLSENGLKVRDSLELFAAIETSRTVKCLKLDNNMIGVRGAQRFAKLLTINKALLRVSLFKTKIKDKGAVAIGEALAANNALEFLSIGGNSVGPTGAKAIASSLKQNTALICLDLRENSLGDSGAVFHAQALRSNETLRELYLCRNAIGDAGVVAISDSLANNRALLGLSIHENAFSEDGVAALARLMNSNKTLKRLNATSLSSLSSAAQFNAFAQALVLNRSLEGVQLSVWCPGAMETLSQKLRCHETLRDLSIFSYASDMSPLFGALASNRSLRAFELHGSLNFDNAKALAKLLRATTTIRSVNVAHKVCNVSLMPLVHGLASNASVWTFRVGSHRLGINLCKAIANMLEVNRTLSTLVLDGATVDEAGLMTVDYGLSANQILQHLSIAYPASSAAGFSVSESLRRNGSLLSHAAQFALKTATDRDSAAAFQFHQRSEFFAHELSLLPEVLLMSSAKSLIREANSYIVRNYFIVTGVVKRCLVCRRRPREGTTQFDELNVYCLYEIASYLKVSDVRR
ncbi:unnamed protein product [Ixodes hexagonus]